MISAIDALRRLREGNRRFVDNVRGGDTLSSRTHRSELMEDHVPFAAVLGCSDARVPVELVFDQALGDLFVIRVAGNVVAPSQIGSVEFAAERTGARLVVVLGHSGCGAVRATLEDIVRPSNSKTANLTSIVDRICPPLLALVDSKGEQDIEDLMPRAVRTNIRTSVRQLRSGSTLIERLVREQGLLIVGAEYSLQTGAVEFFDAPA